MYVVKKLKIMGRSYRTVLFPAPVGPITLEHGILEYFFKPCYTMWLTQRSDHLEKWISGFPTIA
jgi:hypothetical protein